MTLWVAIGSGTCDRFDRVDVTETEEEVSVIAIVDSAAGQSTCTAAMIISLVEVTLEQPLGSREVTGCLLNREGSYFDADRGIDRASCADVVADAFAG